MTAILHWITNPFEPLKGLKTQQLAPGLTVWDVIQAQGLKDFKAPTIVFYEGAVILRKDWSEVRVLSGEALIFYTLPQGGGGGGIFRTVLTVGAMVVAPMAAPALAGALGISGAIGTGLITAGIAFGGATLVNALIPPPQPRMPGRAAPQAMASLASPSPTYSLSAQGNEARLYEPIPVIYGHMKVFPDFASVPYQVFQENQQYLCQLLMIGVGSYEMEKIFIEESPLSSFKEIEHEVIHPGDEVMLFDPLVTTAGEVGTQELEETWCGPFILNGPETQVHKIEIDIVCPRGLYAMNSRGAMGTKSLSFEIQVRALDSEGNPKGDWTSLGKETLSASSHEVIRKTYSYDVDADRYEVRAKRSVAKDKNVRVGHEVRWVGLKGYLNAENHFKDATLLALKMRATNNLSQRSARRINCLVTRKLRAWNPETGWGDLIPTRSIAWALADVLKSKHGAELKDQRIDLAALHRLDQIWQERKDTFDGVFDQKATLWEALTKIARVGRSMCYLQGGIVRIVRDAQKTMPLGLFTPRNIVKGSFRVQYLTPSDDMADTVTLEFLNERTWEQDEVTVSLSGADEKKDAKTYLFGATQKEQVEREARYMALSNLYRRQLVTFETELEGLIPTYGDLIHITHDVPSWGQGAEVLKVEGLKLILSENLKWQRGKEHVIGLRDRDGSLKGPYRVKKGPLKTQVLLEEEIDLEIYEGVQEEQTHATFGTLENWGKRARVLSVKPRASSIEINAILEDDRVHEEVEVDEEEG